MASPSEADEGRHRDNSDGHRKTGHAACVNCHQRKIKCDAHKRGFPCSNCISSRRPHCKIHEKKRRSAMRYGTDPVPIRRKARIQAQAYSREDENHVNSPPHHHQQSINIPSPNEVTPFHNQTPGSNSSESDPSTLRRHLVDFLDQHDLGQRSIQRGVRITYVGKDVSNINFLVRQHDGGENETVHHFPSDELARQFITHEPERIPKDAFVLPEQALADELVEAYFKHVNPSCPIVDEEIFMSQYRGRNSENAPSLLVLQAILLVGAHVARPKPERDVLKATFFRRAKMLFDARVERNRDVVVQAALLMTWHSDGAEDICANAWYWVGVAARIATGLGMHRDATPSTLNASDKRTWRRTWWILVQFDVKVSLSYGRPQAINLDECDVQPLTMEDFENSSSQVQADYVIQATELCVLISKSLRERFGLRVSPEDRKIALRTSDDALASWCLHLPASLQLHSTSLDPCAADLHLTYNNFLILLHRPHPRANKSHDHGPNDADICSAAATTIASIFETMRTKDRIKTLWISGLNALFTAMIQISVELRFSNPVLAINALWRFDSCLLSLREVADYWLPAESILRLFEESSTIQHNIRLGKPGQTALISQNEQHMEQTDLDVLAAAANAAGNHNEGLQSQNEYQWQQLNMDGDSMNGGVLQGPFVDGNASVVPMESEWREIYWQEPGISGSFNDGMWGWP